MTKNKAFIGTVVLRHKGKVYGATTRQVNAKDREDARKKLKENFKFKDKEGTYNVVTVPKIRLKKRRR